MTAEKNSEIFSERGPYGQLGPAALPPTEDFASPLAFSTLSEDGHVEYKTRLDSETGKEIIFNMQEETASQQKTKKLCLNMGAIDRVAFDVDGLLVNSEPVILFTIMETAKDLLKPEYRKNFSDHSEAIKEECFGRSECDMSNRLFNYLNDREMLQNDITQMEPHEFFEFFVAERQARFVQFCQDGLIQPMPGAVEFVKECYEIFGSLAINTGSPESLSRPMLRYAFQDHLDVDAVFPHPLRTYVSDLPAGRGKPNPDGYIRAAIKSDTMPNRMMAIVDRGNDARSAIYAGYGLVLIIPENLDDSPLVDMNPEKGKHSLSRLILTEPEKLRAGDAEKIIIADSLSQIELKP